MAFQYSLGPDKCVAVVIEKQILTIMSTSFFTSVNIESFETAILLRT